MELFRSLLECAACRFCTTAEKATGKEWVDFGTLVFDYADEATRKLFEPYFTSSFLRPLQRRLLEVSEAAGDSQRHAAAASLQAFLSESRVEDLGPMYSQ